MEHSPKNIITDLRKKGYRITPQREQILNLFYEIPEGTHLSAEEVFIKVKEKNLSISLATLYRTLKLLASMGLLRELDFAEDHKHYELFRGKKSHHHHLICIECNKNIEVQDNKHFEIGQELAQKNGFNLIDIQLNLYGTCKDCQKDNNNS